MVDAMSWLLKRTFIDEAELKRGMEISRAGVGTVYASAALPLKAGDAFVLEASVESDGAQRWAAGVVRARGTGVLTLQLPEARHLVRRERGFALLPRRSARLWAGVPVHVLGKAGQPFTCELMEVSAEGARLRGDCSAAGQQVELALPLGAALLPLARAQVCWRTTQQAGLKLIATDLALAQLLRLLASRWKSALPLLAPGQAPPSHFAHLAQRPQPLVEALAVEMSACPRPEAAQEPQARQGPAAGFGRLLPGH